VVVILIDTLRADRLGCYGYEPPTSPAIDALAARGIRYERAFASSSWTWPSTASLLTGLTPPEHGLTDRSSCYLAHELATLPETFVRAGYWTAAYSSNPLVSTSYNFNQGFDVFEEFGMVPTADFLPRVLSWIEEHADERFLLYLHITDPHGPYQPDMELAVHLVAEKPEGYEHGTAKDLLTRRQNGEEVDEELLAACEAYISSRYDGEVRVADEAVARLLARIDGLGLTDKTIVALTSDHGEEFMDHWRNGHGNQLYDELVRVPLVLAGPGLPSGEVQELPVQNRFLARTLCRLAGLGTAEYEAEGDLVLDELVQRGAREPVLLSTARGIWMSPDGRDRERGVEIHGIRVPGFALDWAPLEPGSEDDRVRLFDLDQDPDMRVDVAAEHAERVRELVQVIANWVQRGSERRPVMLDGGRHALRNMQDLGYAGEDEE
jgi:arylsulfatase A-like enzyme